MPGKIDEDSVAGWSLLDDAFYRDEDGHLHFVTRLDNMLTAGGRQTAATEVEDALNSHPAVTESAVVGKAHETRTEIVKAFVVLTQVRHGRRPHDRATGLRKKLRSIFILRESNFWTDFRRTTSGKYNE